MDDLLLALQNVCQQLLPILGAAVLIFLCIFLKKLSDLIVQITATVKNLGPTLAKVDDSMAKIQAPLDTAVKYSNSLDRVHDKTSRLMGKATDFATKSLDRMQAEAEAATEQETPKETAHE